MTYAPRCSACQGHPKVVWEVLCPEHALFESPALLASMYLLSDVARKAAA